MSDLPDHEALFLATLGGRVRAQRTLRALSRKALSAASGLSERYIAQLEGGRGNVSVLLLRRIALAMGVRLDDLLAPPDTPADWPVLRDLLARAAPEQAAQARRALGLSGAPAASGRRIALIGLRGAGKSTLGRLAAERLGSAFVELNREIERENGLPVQEIFSIYGQEDFRRMEQAALQHVAARPGPLVLATGGGIVAEPVTFELLVSSFFTVWLKARPDEHLSRLRDQGDTRAPVAGPPALDALGAVLRTREPLYAQAHAVVDTSDVPVAQALDRLLAAVRPIRP